MERRQLIRAGLSVAMAIPMALASLTATAQTYPNKPITMVVPFPPGGSVDPLARLLGAKLGDPLKTQIVVENRPGAGGVGPVLLAEVRTPLAAAVVVAGLSAAEAVRIRSAARRNGTSGGMDGFIKWLRASGARIAVPAVDVASTDGGAVAPRHGQK